MMIASIGESFLCLAFIISTLQIMLTLCCFLFNLKSWRTFIKPFAILQFLFILLSFLILIFAFINDDFSIYYVAQNSHPSLPLLYRATAIWGAHEGSILLWILALNTWTLFYIIWHFKDPDHLVLFFLNLINFGFIAFSFFTSNPFLQSAIPLEAKDLNPLLQDPGFVFHPPALYLGYVGFSVAYALTFAKLIQHQLNNNWVKITKQFAILAWSFLTLGIFLGSWWSYRVLGWGGYWFWDPVENASLLPWLSGIALIHILALVEKKEILKKWAVFLAMITFVLSIFGTFLVRSGILISAHTFANDPSRGLMLLCLLLSLLGISLMIYLWQSEYIKNISKTVKLKSDDIFLVINSGLLFCSMLIVLLGTLYPIILEVFHLGTVSVGAPYFNLVLLPILVLVLIFMGLTPLAKTKALYPKKIIISFFVSFLFSFLILIYTKAFNIIQLFSLSLCLWIISNTFYWSRYLKAMTLAHVGFAILVIGILLSSFLNQEKEELMKIHDLTTIGPYQFELNTVESVQGPNFRSVRANFVVLKGQRIITTLNPEKRIYETRDMILSKVDIHPGLFRDLYITLGSPIENDWQVRIYYKPFIGFIWLGALLMFCSGFYSFFNNQFRYRYVKN